ncbi:MAG TPA: hypothetical protein ENK06_10285, partial [Gammaproteobacteria bacterium]|nr:hypothetical protein [Gammaproteobacteria bacterium]
MSSFKQRFIQLSLILSALMLIVAWAGAEYMRHEPALFVALMTALSLGSIGLICLLVNNGLLESLSELRVRLNYLVNHEENHSALPEQDYEELQVLADAFTGMQGKIQQKHAELKHQSLHDALTGLP